jgi:hypothetical protein
MTLSELLAEKQSQLIGRWQEAILNEYGDATAARWRRLRDPFANPVGHALSAGLPLLFQEVRRDGELTAEATTALENIVRIRSVQELAPSRAAGFFLHLREAIRSELAAELESGTRGAELAALEKRIERLGMIAFDLYVRFRDQIFRLRHDELKRSVASLLRRWHGGELPESNSNSEAVPMHAALNRVVPR